ncbi:MAG: type II secretion system F family protein [Candidatus Micrarchaeia archaeon]
MLIPLSLLPQQIVIALSKHLIGLSGRITEFFPFLSEKLPQAEIDLSQKEYAAIAATVGISNAVIASIALFTLGSIAKVDFVFISAIFAFLTGFASFVTVIYYPKIIAAQRIRNLEKGLIPAVRQLTIELRSGVPLFNAMTTLTVDYEEVSKEFKKIVKKVESGQSEQDALNNSCHSIPSMQFKQVLWQISNALNTGSDIATALDASLQELSKNKIEEINKYGNELSPLTMIYMMAAIVLPSLGVTMLIILSGFLGSNINSSILIVIFLIIIGFQAFFAHFISTRRPLI